MASLSVSAWPLSTSRAMVPPSDASGSVPHTPSTPSKSNYITGLKGLVGAGPFFHALLNQGQRIDESKHASFRPESSPFSSKKSSRELMPSPDVHTGRAITTGDCENVPRESPGHAQDPFAPRGVGAAFFPANSDNPFPQHSKARITRSASLMPPPTTDQDFCRWAIGAGAQAAKDAQKDLRRYHYLTRSQSVDAGFSHKGAPRLQRPNASYDPGYGELHQVPPEFAAMQLQPAEHQGVDEVDPSSLDTLVSYGPTRGRNLSPIEEMSLEKPQGDASSISSVTSTPSHLFIHRSVRRAGSASSLASGHSATSYTHTDDPTTPITSSLRTGGQIRQPFSTLPVIPASPRESQNVFDSEPTGRTNSSIGSPRPQPIIVDEDAQYAIFDPPKEEQDIAETLPTPMFAIPLYRGEDEHSVYTGDQVTERDVGDGNRKTLPRISIPVSEEPSLLSRSASVRTELTYLTAQDSRRESRRISTMHGADVEGGFEPDTSGQMDGDTTLVDPQPERRPGPAARLRASLESLVQRARSRKKASSGLDSLSHLKWLTFVHARDRSSLKEDEHYRKPAEILFWTGFIAPWCWLIGGWVLSRSGEMRSEGLPRGVRNSSGPSTPRNASTIFRIQKQPSIGQTPGFSVHEVDLEKGRTQRLPLAFEKDGRSAWSSADLLSTLRGSTGNGNQNPSTAALEHERAREQAKTPNSSLRALKLRSEVAASPEMFYMERKLDRWVIRCRIAAMISGTILLILVIVALIVMARAL